MPEHLQRAARLRHAFGCRGRRGAKAVCATCPVQRECHTVGGGTRSSFRGSRTRARAVGSPAHSQLFRVMRRPVHLARLNRSVRRAVDQESE